MSAPDLHFPIEDSFQWDSKDQKKGYEAFLYWAHKKGINNSVKPIDLFFIQKDHESLEWIMEVMNTHMRYLQDEIMKLKEEIAELK